MDIDIGDGSGEISSEDEDEDEAVVKSDYQLRKEYNKTRDFTVVKCGLSKLCDNHSMRDLLELCVQRCSIMAVEASLLASIHVLRVLDPRPATKAWDDEILPNLDDKFFNQCICSIANLNTGQKDNNPELTFTLHHYYQPLKPDEYEAVDRIPGVMNQMLNTISQTARQNFVVSLEQTIFKRLRKWIDLQIRQREGPQGEEDYFCDNSEYNGHKIRWLMVRCCTEEVTVLGIMNLYKKIRDRPIPLADIHWMQALCDEVKQNLVITPLQVSRNPEVYMPFLRRMLHDFETSGEPIRLFSLLPQKEIKPLHITINTTILKALHKHLNKNVINPPLPDNLWEYYFDTRHLTKRNKTFEEFILTDGLSASVTVSRAKRVAAPVAAPNARVSARNAFLQADRVVSVDPGRNPIISGVVYNAGAMNVLAGNPNIHLEKVKWGKKEHYHECGFNERLAKTNMWMSKNLEITQYNNNGSSSKTSDLETYMAHAIQVLRVLHQRMAFFSSKRFRRLKWKTYIRTQKAYEKVVAKLKGGVPNTLVIWGNAKFPSNGKGSPSVPTKTMRKKVGARVRVLEQDEYRTSKLSCCCHEIMTGLEIAGRRSYHVRVCPNVNCPRSPWDRNVSAAINILFLFTNYNVDGHATPEAFRRAPPPAVAAP